MTDAFTLLPDEIVILTQEAGALYSGTGFVPGRLHLTNKRLVFLPKGLEEAGSDAKLIAVPLRTVQSVIHEEGPTPCLIVKTALSTFHFRARAFSRGLLDSLEPGPATLRGAAERLDSRDLQGRPGREESLAAHRTGASRERKTEKVRLDPQALARLDERKEVLILGDTEFYRVKLSRIFDRLDLRRSVFHDPGKAMTAVRERPDHYSLMIVNLVDPAFGGVEFLESRKTEGLAPGVVTWAIEALFEKLPDPVLRGFGITGFLNRSVEPNEIIEGLDRFFRGEPSAQSRRNPRVTAYFPVEYQLRGEPEIGYVNKLGTGGIFIESDRPCHPNEPVDVRFRVLESNEVVEVSGSVLYRVAEPKREEEHRAVAGIGIKFGRMRPEHQSVIRTFIEKLLQEKVNEATVVFGV